MISENTINKLKQIADNYDVDLEFSDKDKNESNSRGHFIELGKFDNEDELIITFFHELAHSLTSGLLLRDFDKEGKHIIPSTLASEGFAWVHAVQLAKENGYEWPIGHKVYQFMYEALFSYVFYYNDDIFRNKMNKNEIKNEYHKYLSRRNNKTNPFKQ